MISVQNRLLPLNGSKWLFFIIIIIVAAACSPKVRQAAAPAKTEAPVAKAEPVKPPVKPAVAQVSSIAMLLPFDLDNLSPGLQYTAATWQRAILSLDYYQGFKLALDSLTGQGYSYKLQVYDTREQPATSHSLAYTPAIRTSDLIVGPVFPDDLQAFSSAFGGIPKSIVSPLSPTSPAHIQSQSLITVATPLEYHAAAAAKYINKNIDPKKIFILRSGFSDENNYIVPFKKALDSLAKGKTKIISAGIVHGQLNGLLPQLSATDDNVFVIPSTDQPFLMVTLRSLDTLAKKYKITVFGHPSWEKFTYLNAGLLQRLDTHITSSSRIDYKSKPITDFIKLYRKTYHTDPTEYAFMGFDEGLYFGGLLGSNKDNLKKLGDNDFAGMLNSFHFVKKPGLGWVNTHVIVWKYSNFELKRAQ